MIRREAGFSLVELMVTMVVFVFFIAAASSVFTGLLTQFKQQSKMAETNIEGIIGLEMLRQDIESAGYGLPWNIPSGVTYTEATSTTICSSVDPSTYNDAAPDAPKTIVSGNGSCTNGSDYLVIKAINVATNDTSSKWTELIYSTTCTSPLSNFATNVCKRSWTPSTEDLSSSDNVIVISPGATSTTERLLMANSGAFTATSFGSIDSSWLPQSATDNIRIVYGLNSGNAPKRPFNRGDYYISTSNVPQRCAPNTGVLEKAVMDYAGGFTQFPLLDCVADMQVVFGVDTDTTLDGQINCYTNNLANVFATVNAQNIRERVREIRVYILSHEGQLDRNFTLDLNARNAGLNPSIGCPTCIRVGEGLPLAVCEGGIAGQDFNLSTITDYLRYRWKVYTLVVKPNNLE
jgi:prepilin-type N-terminal cleavage/methylation domain-containing protein